MRHQKRYEVQQVEHPEIRPDVVPELAEWVARVHLLGAVRDPARAVEPV
jgi:hypothetical protein